MDPAGRLSRFGRGSVGHTSIFKTRSLPRTLHLGSFQLVLEPFLLDSLGNPGLPAFLRRTQNPFNHSAEAIQAILAVLFAIPESLGINPQNSGFRDPTPL
jgi:hypothetical protein